MSFHLKEGRPIIRKKGTPGNWQPEIDTKYRTSGDPSNFKFAQSTIDFAKSILHSNVEHLVVLGTCAEYGYRNSPSTAGLTPLHPNSLYADQKIVTLRAIAELLSHSEIRFTWARVFYPYGPGQDSKRLIPHLIEALKSDKPIELADTSSYYDWVSVRDIASAISWIISKRISSEIDIGTTIGFTNLEILNNIMELMPNISKMKNLGPHEIGISEVFVVGKDSPILKSGWLPKDSLKSGLEWVLNS